jgi:fucose 4-O-acetylase-like acetyltransferase
MTSLWDTLLSTPWWVYVLFIYLVLIGIKSSKTRVVSLRKLFFVPAIFLVLSAHTLLTTFNITPITVGAWALALAIGVVLGFLQIARLNVAVDRAHKLVKVPGSWTTLVIILIIFFSKYYFGYALAVHPDYTNNTHFELTMLAISGLFSGALVGRLVCYLYRMTSMPSVNLHQQSIKA